MAKFEGPDFLHDTPARATGSETEFTVQRQQELPYFEQIEALKPTTLVLLDSDNAWCRNGARIYRDYGSEEHDDTLEYATPECTSAEELLVHEKAGEVLAERIAREIADPGASWPIYKRTAYCTVRDRAGRRIKSKGSVGHHESYATPLEETYYADHALRSYLATRPVWAGAGIVTPKGYGLSQKVRGTSFENPQVNLVNHGQKSPLWFKDDQGYVEIRSGDGNMLPWAIRTKHAMTSLVLRLIEHEVFPDEAIYGNLHNIHAAAHLASADPRFQPSFSHYNAADHQVQIAESALEFAASHPNIPAEEIVAAQDVLATSILIGSGAAYPEIAYELSTTVDWAAKLHRIHRLGRSSKQLAEITTTDLRNVQLDLEWEAVGTTTPSAQVGYDMPTEAAIRQALITPPASRAQVRTDFLREHIADVTGVEWGHVRLFNNPYSIHIYWSSPDINQLRTRKIT